jgi:hypothetical protein
MNWSLNDESLKEMFWMPGSHTTMTHWVDKFNGQRIQVIVSAS